MCFDSRIRMIPVPLISCASVIVNDQRGPPDWHAPGLECEILPNTEEVPSLSPAPTLPWAACWWVFSVTEASKAFQFTRRSALLPAPSKRMENGEKREKKVYLAVSWCGSCRCEWEQNELPVTLQLINPPTPWHKRKDEPAVHVLSPV